MTIAAAIPYKLNPFYTHIGMIAKRDKMPELCLSLTHQLLEIVAWCNQLCSQVADPHGAVYKRMYEGMKATMNHAAEGVATNIGRNLESMMESNEQKLIASVTNAATTAASEIGPVVQRRAGEPVIEAAVQRGAGEQVIGSVVTPRVDRVGGSAIDSVVPPRVAEPVIAPQVPPRVGGSAIDPAVPPRAAEPVIGPLVPPSGAAPKTVVPPSMGAPERMKKPRARRNHVHPREAQVRFCRNQFAVCIEEIRNLFQRQMQKLFFSYRAESQQKKPNNLVVLRSCAGLARTSVVLPDTVSVTPISCGKRQKAILRPILNVSWSWVSCSYQWNLKSTLNDDPRILVILHGYEALSIGKYHDLCM